MLKKIVIIGPESTGKSTLSNALAKHYNTIWCPEYAREYLLTFGKIYTYDNLLEIAKGQIALEEKYLQEAKDKHQSLVVIDTDMYVMRVWCQYVFQKVHTWIEEQIAERTYDLYLLCQPDLPWTKDELREYPEENIRKELYGIYKNILINQSVPWAEVSGTGEARTQSAILSIDKMLG
jgi:NadR type nicotinamide-nucleotide adenylyltransferase